ncbi:PaaI family thioesterase [Oceaniglobus indicus]|uniref:PaaI family thioesterase n=1 Tax=Oceaniglobus indicus TaxID=2047749 RepID=UPI000C18E8D7|nr:PaaI family thioesterase [Oceaniglobus indicus]
MTLQMDTAALNAFLDREFAQVSRDFRVVSATAAQLKLRMTVSDQHLRPGGTVSGPTMFALADVAVYLAILSHIGPRALSVTTSCSIDFMRKPAAATPLIAEARILKLGRVLAVGDVLVFSEGHDAPVARASLTYSIPPAKP